MSKLLRALFCALLVLALLQTTNGGKFGSGRSGGRHSYPSSGGLSGSGSRRPGGLSGGHGYPSSGGLSGSGGSHGYPSGGLSGSGGSHGYPSGGLSGSGSSHGYPSSGGMSGSGAKPGYPSSGGMSGSGARPAYPSAGTQNHGYPSNRGSSGNTHTTVINHNYHYSPPQRITYGGPGQTAHSYPVYQGQPPNYVYQYKNSNSKYGTLLAGLALLNLGTLGASVYTASKIGSNSGSGSGGTYKTQPGEYCKFGVKKENGDYEETRIDCNLITSFIFQEEAKTPQQNGASNSVVTTVTNVTVVNMTNGVPDVTTTTTLAPKTLYEMLPNGTLVPVNVTQTNAGAVNVTQNATVANANGTLTSSMTVTTTTTTTNTTNALDVKGDPIKVTSGMQCFILRHTPTTNMKKTVPCGLLQSYADQSIKKNSAAKNIPTFTVLCAIAAFVFY